MGKPSVVSFSLSEKTEQEHSNSKDRHEKLEFWSILGSAASGSEHILSKALVTYAQSFLASSSSSSLEHKENTNTSAKPSAALLHPSDFQSVAGKGATCKVNNTSVTYGTAAFLESHSIQLPQQLVQVRVAFSLCLLSSSSCSLFSSSFSKFTAIRQGKVWFLLLLIAFMLVRLLLFSSLLFSCLLFSSLLPFFPDLFSRSFLPLFRV
jgi:hypothetical protein